MKDESTQKTGGRSLRSLLPSFILSPSATSIARRFLVLIALMFWQGGFLFYASVVVPISTRILGSASRQGFITREVTSYLNLAAAAGLALLAWDVMGTRDASRLRYRTRFGLWLFMVLCQVLLFIMHTHLDGMMELKGRIIHDLESFRPMHRLYLWTHTFQWGAALIFIALMLRAWQMEDSSLSHTVGDKASRGR